MVGATNNSNLLGIGTSGILDQLVNCSNPYRADYYCYRQCYETINAWEVQAGSVDFFGCDNDNIFSAEEQLDFIQSLQNLAIAATPADCDDGSQMVPLNYDVYAHSQFSPAQFSVIITYGSACTTRPDVSIDEF